MGLHDLSVEGSTFYRSPNIDNLARTGMRFTQGYATCRVCSPSRASIQLGQFTARHGITQWIGARSGMDWKREDPLLPAEYVRALPDSDVSLAEALQQAGYKTFFAGKWHLGGEGSLPTDHGFEINVGGHHRGSPPGGFFTPYRNPQMKDGPSGESLTLRLGSETASFIRDHQDKPFFAMLSFYSVHAPVQTT
ncbi:MAG: sulfatase-like hydrolase/transferase, partial [Planctomycetota bacterium]